MPKAKKPSSQAAQSKRFVETAKKLEVDESGKSFEKAFQVLTPHAAYSSPTINDTSRKKSSVSKK